LLQQPTGGQSAADWLSTCENFESSRLNHRFFTSTRNAGEILRFADVEPTTITLEELPSPLASATKDRCPNCSAPMASDQRYCIECGERRAGGGLREALPRTQPAAAAAPLKQRRSFFASPNTSLIAGVATLLLAMGVGVLIGRTGHTTTPARSAPAQVITVPTASGAAATGSGSTGAAAATAATAGAVKHKAAKAHKKAAAAKTAQTDIQKTAAKSGVKLPPPVVKIGQKCAKGAKGCQGGKFTGNFFGGG
jgi:hypothetical protein